jgi:hypothetical protein
MIVARNGLYLTKTGHDHEGHLGGRHVGRGAVGVERGAVGVGRGAVGVERGAVGVEQL